MKAYPCSGEINFRVDDAKETVARVLAHFQQQQPVLDHTDGVSADFADWRFNLRSSNTEPLLRLNIETRGDDALLRERIAELTALIGGTPANH